METGVYAMKEHILGGVYFFFNRDFAGHFSLAFLLTQCTKTARGGENENENKKTLTTTECVFFITIRGPVFRTILFLYIFILDQMHRMKILADVEQHGIPLSLG